jgi:hypothetical protein
LRLFHFALQGESRLPMPPDWAAIRDRFQQGPLQPLAKELSAMFGDQVVLAELRKTLASSEVPFPARRDALLLLGRVADRESVELYPTLLKSKEMRKAILQLRSSDCSRPA